MIQNLLYPRLRLNKDLQLSQTKRTSGSLLDKVQKICEILVLTGIRTDARNDLLVKSCFTFEEQVETLGQPASQRRRKQRKSENQQRFNQPWSDAVTL